MQNGFVAALPYLVMWISINLSGLLADYLRENGLLTTTQVRKSANTIGSYVRFFSWRIFRETLVYVVYPQRDETILHTRSLKACFYSTSASFAASVGPAIFLVAAGYVGCNKVAAVSLICISMLFCGFQFSGFNSNHIDIASR